jgi:hypothetical protein
MDAPRLVERALKAQKALAGKRDAATELIG